MPTAALLVVLFGAVVGGMVWFASAPTVVPLEEIEGLGVNALPAPRAIADFELVHHTGRSFTRHDLEGRWSFLFFGYASCPDICPITMSIMGQAEQLLEGDAFQGVLVSVDPRRDSIDVIAEYVGAFSASFVGVTGQTTDIETFAHNLGIGFRVPDESLPADYLVEHSPYIVIVDPSARHFGYIKPPFDPNKLALTYRSLVAAQ